MPAVEPAALPAIVRTKALEVEDNWAVDQRGASRAQIAISSIKPEDQTMALSFAIGESTQMDESHRLLLAYYLALDPRRKTNTK